MASSGIQMGLVFSLATILWTGATAQSGCTNVLIGMAPCLSYITGSSSTPSSSCCSQLSSVVQSQPQCLCAALNGGGSALGISINRTLALALPGACNVQTPPVTFTGPATSPVASPEGMPEESSNGTPGSLTSSSGGSKAVPSNGSTSDGSTNKTALQFVTLLLFMASWASVSSTF